MNLKNSKIALFVFSLGAVALIGCNNNPVTSKVTITFDGNGGTVTPANGNSEKVTVDKGTLFKDVKAPKAEKTDYTFDAWTSTKDDITTKIKDDYVFNADITLFAHYTAGETYTYKFVDGDKTIKEDTIKKGEVIVAPEDLDDKHAQDTDEKYYHFSFDGWYDGETKFVIGTTISKDVTYTSKFTKGNEITHLDGEVPTCSEPGYKEAYMCEDCYPVNTYYDVPNSIDDEHLIGDLDEYNYWISEEGEGYLEPTGEHNYQPEFRGTYKTTYTALETFDKTGLEVYLHCSYETEHTNDVKIDDFDIEYEADDDKLHVNDGGAYVSFTYEGEDYEKDLELTVNPISVDEPAEDTTSFTYDGNEKTYNVTETDDYSVSGNKQTNAGEYTVTISLKDDSGDHVWKTSEDTDDLEYDFVIAKAANAITGFATSYTTTCHTAPTITGVTATSGTVLYKYYKKVGDADEVEVNANELEKADNTTYRVKAYVPESGNYEAVEQYATLTVNHDWNTEYAPTDVIGYKAHECKGCKTIEHTTSVMADSDIDLYEAEESETNGYIFHYGMTPGTINSTEPGSEPFEIGDIKYPLPPSSKPKQIDLPKINFEAYQNQDILLKFRTNNAPGWGSEHTVYLGTNAEANNLFDGTNEARWAGSVGPDMTGYFLLNYNSTSKELTIKNTIEPNKIVTINDSDIIQGKKSISLYGYSEAESRTFALFEGCITLNHTHSWGEYVVPTDKIGNKYRECSICKEREYALMDDTDIAANFTAKDSFGANAGDWATGSPLGQRWQGTSDDASWRDMIFAHVDYTKFETVTFHFNTDSNSDPSWGLVGLSTVNGADTCDLIAYENHGDNLSGTIAVSKVDGENKLEIVVKDSSEGSLGSKTIDVSESVINGSDGLNLFAKLLTWRSFAISAIIVTVE